MSEFVDPVPPTYDPLPVPISAWLLGWSFVAGQVLDLVVRGTQPESAWPLSIPLGVLIVVFISHGVMRARMIRFWFVVVLMVLAVVLGLVGLVVEPTVDGALSWVLSLAQARLLWTYAHTQWFGWQRTRASGGPSLVPILAVAALVGALGGLIGPAEGTDTGLESHLTVRTAAR